MKSEHEVIQTTMRLLEDCRSALEAKGWDPDLSDLLRFVQIIMAERRPPPRTYVVGGD